MDYMTDGKAVEIRTEDGRVVVGPGALELISSWEWLQEANRNARRGKRTRPSIMQYQDDLEHNLIQTSEEMRAGTYRTGPYRRLWVYIPKRRLVMALDYRDRVVQWSVYQHHYVSAVCRKKERADCAVFWRVYIVEFFESCSPFVAGVVTAVEECSTRLRQISRQLTRMSNVENSKR